MRQHEMAGERKLNTSSFKEQHLTDNAASDAWIEYECNPSVQERIAPPPAMVRTPG